MKEIETRMFNEKREKTYIKNASKDKKVFLGGTCNNSDWRKEFEDKLEIDFFNPVVEDWTEEAKKEEEKQKKDSDYSLYLITPKIKGYYSIAEAVDDSNKYPERVIFGYIKRDEDESFDKQQINSLEEVGKVIEDNGGKFFRNTTDIINFLNKK